MASCIAAALGREPAERHERLELAGPETLTQDAMVRIVLRAAGKHFSSGGNINGFLEASPEHVSKLAWNVAAPARCGKPVIAAARGSCFGVGFELSLACDFRLCTETTEYALPEQKLGQPLGAEGFEVVEVKGLLRCHRAALPVSFPRQPNGRFPAYPATRMSSLPIVEEPW